MFSSSVAVAVALPPLSEEHDVGSDWRGVLALNGAFRGMDAEDERHMDVPERPR